MRITLHNYVTDPSLPQKDGVNLAHENIAQLLRNSSDDRLAVSFHDLNLLLTDDRYARSVLAHVDCVVSNVGPHAHYYCYLREKLGLDFRIIRDVRTAIWSSYLLQEHLCQPYLRDQDVLLVASHYTRGVYEKLFPHLEPLQTVRCYPLTVGFPAVLPPLRRDPGAFTIGYVGRLSEDKNLPDIVDLLVVLNRDYGGYFKLVACGDVHSASCRPEAISAHVRNELGSGDYFEYFPARANGDIWELYRRFDAMVFPSTSNLETLGRVLVEASYAGIPVICGDHAAAPELMPSGSLCSVSYSRHKTFSAHFDHSLGRLSIAEMAQAVTNPALTASDCHLDYQQHPAKFLAILHKAADGIEQISEPLHLTPAQRSFIEALEVELPEALSLERANALIERLIPWFIKLQARGTQVRLRCLSDLAALSKHPRRTERYIDKSSGTRCDFTDVGGIDIELCHVAGFYPEFRLLDAPRSAGRPGQLVAGRSFCNRLSGGAALAQGA